VLNIHAEGEALRVLERFSELPTIWSVNAALTHQTMICPLFSESQWFTWATREVKHWPRAALR
jgi:hypothetical protein